MRQSTSTVSAARRARMRLSVSRASARQSTPAGSVESLIVDSPATGAVPSLPPDQAQPDHLAGRRPSWRLSSIGVVLGLLLLLPMWVALSDKDSQASRGMSAAEVDKAIQSAFKKQAQEPASVRAVQRLMPSVVRVVGFERQVRRKGAAHPHTGGVADASGKSEPADMIESGVGTGTVINRQGLILTSLHVVQGTDRIQIQFADGSESDADVVNTRPEQDLAVLQARAMPEGIPPAVLKGSDRLREGEPVVAIGFPFGIGPSVSSGVVSGKERKFASPEGKSEMSDLIQFDAAANPGNSGGPLATMDGEVVGVVAGILNPTRHRTFLGIGFAVPIETAAQAAGLPPF